MIMSAYNTTSKSVIIKKNTILGNKNKKRGNIMLLHVCTDMFKNNCTYQV